MSNEELEEVAKARKPREYWIVCSNDLNVFTYAYAFDKESNAKAFNKGMYGKSSNRHDVTRVREVLDEQGEK